MKAAVTCLLALLVATPIFSTPRLINGTPVPAGQFEEVVNIVTGNAGCTAAVIGPKVVLTAGHCGKEGATTIFKAKGKDYSGTVFRSPLYPSKDHDMALVLVSSEVTDVKPVSVYAGQTPDNGKKIKFLGYGCTNPGGGGGNDGVLREGDATVTGRSNYDIVSKGGAALCYGDSGGPGMIVEPDGKYAVVSVNSKGNIQDTNYTTDLTHAESKKFFEKFATEHSVDICGINKDCNGPPVEKFSLENSAVKISGENKGLHDVQYVKTVIEMAMMFLESGKSTMIKHHGDPPPGMCSCGLGYIAACDSTGFGRCGAFNSCQCD